MDGCNVLPDTQFVGTRLRVDTTRVLYVGGTLPPWGAVGERSEFNIQPPLGALLLIFPRGYLLKSFPQVDTSARQRGFKIGVFPCLHIKIYICHILNAYNKLSKTFEMKTLRLKMHLWHSFIRDQSINQISLFPLSIFKTQNNFLTTTYNTKHLLHQTHLSI